MFDVETGWFDERFPFARFGDGERTLVVFPGASDPLFDGDYEGWLARALRWRFRRFTDTHEVVVLSRPRGLPEGLSTRDMAGEYAEAVGRLAGGSDAVDVVGLSAGGLVAQWFAIDHGLADRVVLAMAGCRVGEEGERIVRRWGRYARLENWGAIVSESVEETYTGWRRHVYGALTGLPVGPRVEPAVPRDVWVTMAAVVDHDCCSALGEIDVPTMVAAGTADPFFPEPVLQTTASGIPAGRFERFEGAGHGVDAERSRAFDRAVSGFLTGEESARSPG